MDLVARVGMRVYQRNAVITEVKSFGTVQLGYGIKKLDGRLFQVNFCAIAHFSDSSPIFFGFSFFVFGGR